MFKKIKSHQIIFGILIGVPLILAIYKNELFQTAILMAGFWFFVIQPHD